MIAKKEHLDIKEVAKAIGIDSESSLTRDIHQVITDSRNIYNMIVIAETDSSPIVAIQEKLNNIYKQDELDESMIEKANRITAIILEYTMELFGYYPYEEPETNSKLFYSKRKPKPCMSPPIPYKKLTHEAKYKKVKYGRCFAYPYNSVGAGFGYIIPLKIESDFRIIES